MTLAAGERVDELALLQTAHLPLARHAPIGYGSVAVPSTDGLSRSRLQYTAFDLCSDALRPTDRFVACWEAMRESQFVGRFNQLCFDPVLAAINEFQAEEGVEALGIELDEKFSPPIHP